MQECVELLAVLRGGAGGGGTGTTGALNSDSTRIEERSRQSYHPIQVGWRIDSP